jgi:hypothetical protein
MAAGTKDRHFFVDQKSEVVDYAAFDTFCAFTSFVRFCVVRAVFGCSFAIDP